MKRNDMDIDEILKRYLPRPTPEEVDAFLASRPDFQRMDVDYNALLGDPVPQTTALAGFLGVPSAAPAMIGAIDPSLYRNRTQ